MAARLAVLFLASCAALAALAAPVSARTPGEACWRAVDRAAAAYRTPTAVFRAMAVVESGRGDGPARVPWPWTITVEGRPHFFETRDQAAGFLAALDARGVLDFDVGCLQVNAGRFGDAFADLPEMLDPEANANFAARRLIELREELGDWMAAIGAYHARTPDRGRAYQNRVMAALRTTPLPAARVEEDAARVAVRPALTPIQRGPSNAQTDAAQTGAARADAAQAEAARTAPLRRAAWRGLLRRATGALAAAPPAPPAARAPAASLAERFGNPPPTAPANGRAPRAGGVELTIFSSRAAAPER